MTVLFPRLDQNALVDFRASWSAARLLCRGENPYDERSLLAIEKGAGWTQPEAVIPWHPPWALLIAIPFALLPFSFSKWVWLAANFLLMLLLADHWWKTYGGNREYRIASWLASIWFFPCIVALYFGQMSLIVLAGVTGMAWSLRHSKVEWLGFFVFLASLKPHLLLPMWLFLILWIGWQKKWGIFIWAASGIVLASIVVACLQPGIYQDYILQAISINGPAIWATPTVGTALRIAFSGVPKWIVFLPGLCSLFLALIFWRKWRRSVAWECHLDIILLLSLSTASYAWIFDWAVLLPVAIRMLVWLQLNPGKQWPTIIGLICVMGIFVWAQARGLFPLGVMWFPWGLALVYGWARWRQNGLGVSGMKARVSRLA